MNNCQERCSRDDRCSLKSNPGVTAVDAEGVEGKVKVRKSDKRGSEAPFPLSIRYIKRCWMHTMIV